MPADDDGDVWFLHGFWIHAAGFELKVLTGVANDRFGPQPSYEFEKLIAARTQGPPGHAHGGATAALLDEAMGFCCWVVGHRVVAAHIEIDFRDMVPVGAVATLEATVERVEGRKVYPRARLLLPGGTVAAESTGIFLMLAANQLELLAGQAEAAGMDPEAFA